MTAAQGLARCWRSSQRDFGTGAGRERAPDGDVQAILVEQEQRWYEKRHNFPRELDAYVMPTEMNIRIVNNGNAALVSKRIMVWPALSARNEKLGNTDKSSSEAQRSESEAVRRDGKCRRRQARYDYTQPRGSAFCILCKKNASWCENPQEEDSEDSAPGGIVTRDAMGGKDRQVPELPVNDEEMKMGHKDSGGKDARCDDPLQDPSAISKSCDSEETAKKLRGRQRMYRIDRHAKYLHHRMRWCGLFAPFTKLPMVVRKMGRHSFCTELSRVYNFCVTVVRGNENPDRLKETYAVCLNAVPEPSANQRRLVDAEQTWNDGSEFVVNINRTKAQMMDLKDQARSSPEVGPDADGDC
ncbi:hypothetical protein H4582DRAFT_2130239 [Lactarius indigo]|nr:hypothetical protein H4582DRAFT_2130239 [Lactarius indigo]